MAIQFYNPFENLHFNPVECFLTGKRISSTEEQVSVFPEWLIDRYSLKDKTLIIKKKYLITFVMSAIFLYVSNSQLILN